MSFRTKREGRKGSTTYCPKFLTKLERSSTGLHALSGLDQMRGSTTCSPNSLVKLERSSRITLEHFSQGQVERMAARSRQERVSVLSSLVTNPHICCQRKQRNDAQSSIGYPCQSSLQFRKGSTKLERSSSLKTLPTRRRMKCNVKQRKFSIVFSHWPNSHI